MSLTNDPKVAAVLCYALHYGPFTTKSDFAREYTDVIAMLACEGLLTTKGRDDNYCNRWRLTAKGHDRIENPHAYQ